MIALVVIAVAWLAAAYLWQAPKIAARLTAIELHDYAAEWGREPDARAVHRARDDSHFAAMFLALIWPVYWPMIAVSDRVRHLTPASAHEERLRAAELQKRIDELERELKLGPYKEDQ